MFDGIPRKLGFRGRVSVLVLLFSSAPIAAIVGAVSIVEPPSPTRALEHGISGLLVAFVIITMAAVTRALLFMVVDWLEAGRKVDEDRALKENGLKYLTQMIEADNRERAARQAALSTRSTPKGPG